MRPGLLVKIHIEVKLGGPKGPLPQQIEDVGADAIDPPAEVGGINCNCGGEILIGHVFSS